MNPLTIIGPIVIGGLIGYCTNYIAIKMLFRPRKEVHFLGHVLPFTPGVIPKNQPRIAKAVGKAVGENLLTGDDLVSVLGNDEIRENVVNQISSIVYGEVHTIKEQIEHSEKMDYQETVDKISGTVTDKIVAGIEGIDMKTLVLDVAKKTVKEKLQDSMLSMFVNDSMIESLASPVAESISSYVSEHGEEMVYPKVESEVNNFCEQDISKNLEEFGLAEETFKDILRGVFKTGFQNMAAGFLQNVDIAGIVEQKINAMDVAELEDLVMQVMKQELQTVINLGAIIGALIGIINIFLL